ncbi:MAG: cbb3-type cytochrome c oxidase N-terminal domain-containing protein [Myxococcota bacterium]
MSSSDENNDVKRHQPSGADDEYPDILLDHNYDGIREYDNPMPGWWKWIFVVTVIWSVIYVAGIMLGYVHSYEDDLAAGQAEIQARKAEHQAEQPEVDTALLEKTAESEDALATGEAIFKTSCATCHGKKGEGLIGPNLTDRYYIHGGSPMDIYETLINGVPDKGMPARGGAAISDEELLAVTAYVVKLPETDPEGGKEPEGELFEPDK